MKGKESIINSILGDAEQQAAQIIAEAKEKADGIVSLAKTKAEQDKQAVLANAGSQAKDISDRRISVAELEVKKYSLSLKQRLLGECFDEALQKLSKLSDKEYLAIIAKLLAYAEDGESVVISKNDKKRITADFIKQAAKGKKITLSKEVGDFSGGIVLTKEGYDKNMTFEVLLSQVREESEADAASVLFKE